VFTFTQPAVFGELAFMFWLLIKGAKPQRWTPQPHRTRRLVRACPTRQCLPVVAALRYASALNLTMTRANKLLDQILRGGADANIPFSGMVQLLKRLGFQERVKGGHHIFFRDGVAEILNLQPHSGKCKPYQVK
jgi:predicted RNA binding protein YcfA (HicA-like mRNA interferase family)